MNTLIDWLGKADDITISFNAELSPGRLLTEHIGSTEDSGVSVDNSALTGSYREVEEVVFEKNIKEIDKIDYLVAVACGSIAGLIDAFCIGEFSLEKAREWGSKETNNFVLKVAKMAGFKGDNLSDAIRFLEKRFPIAADDKIPDFGGGKQHHLRDFSHHFSIGGLLCSVFTQFSSKVIGTDTDGSLKIVSITDETLIGNDFAQKLLFGIVHWLFHMASDMAGTSSTAGRGTGIPGPLVALLKKLSALPCFKDKMIGEVEFHTWFSKLFNGTLLAKRDDNSKITEPMPFDLRTEIGVLHEVGKQFIPVLINECLVRGIYFIRRLYLSIKDQEIHSIKDLKKIDSADLLPYNNRIIRRMVTVSSGVFVAIDTTDALARAVIKNQGFKNDFVKDFVVRINIAGIGRFAVACVADARFITEDIRQAKEKRDRIEKEYEKMISDFSCLSLDYEQTQVLYSIKQLVISDDIVNTSKEEEVEKKSHWNDEWKKQIKNELQLTEEGFNDFFLNEQEIIDYLDGHDDKYWKQLVALEAILFRPYYLLSNSKEEKDYSKLRFKSKYLYEQFVYEQSSISLEDLKNLKKSYKKAMMQITGTTKKIVIGAVGTTALVVITSGVAYFFAPAIATAIVGESASGLYGAALTSYSLAAVGGGSIASGGLGMAGGTAIITGGGSLLGMLSGSGASTVSALSSISNDSFVLSECCKLLAFSKEVLLKRYDDKPAIANIQAIIDEHINRLEIELDSFRDKIDSSDKETSKEEKKKRAVAKKSLKYLDRCNKALYKLITGKADKDEEEKFR